MSACPHYRETLWLDVYNELSPTACTEWKAHLETCEGCHNEKMRLSQLIVTMQENMQPPEATALSPENILRLHRARNEINTPYPLVASAAVRPYIETGTGHGNIWYNFLGGRHMEL